MGHSPQGRRDWAAVTQHAQVEVNRVLYSSVREECAGHGRGLVLKVGGSQRGTVCTIGNIWQCLETFLVVTLGCVYVSVCATDI